MNSRSSDTPERQVRGPAQRNSPARELLLYDVLAFAVPAFSWIEFRAIGRLFLSDVLLLLVLAITLVDRRRLRLNRPLRIIFVLGILWFLNLVAADFVRHTDFGNLARGWSMIALSMCHLFTIYSVLECRRRRVILYALGLAVGGLVGTVANPSELFTLESWKFGYGPPVTWGLVVLAAYCWSQHWRSSTAVILAAATTLNVVMGSRSAAAGTILSIILLRSAPLQGADHRIMVRKLVLLLMVVGVVGYGLEQAYAAIAARGWLGESPRIKVESELSGDAGMVIGARGAIFSALEPIQESPLIGQGSWKDGTEYLIGVYQSLEELGYNSSLASLESDRYAMNHSHFLGAWVQAGVFGGLFWLVVAIFTLRSVFRLPLETEPLAPIILFSAFMLLLDIAFSPFAGERRFLTTYYIVVVLAASGLRSDRRTLPHKRSSPLLSLATPGMPLNEEGLSA